MERLRRILAAVAALTVLTAFAASGTAPVRAAEPRYPPPDFETPYRMPTMTTPVPAAEQASGRDVLLFALAMVLAAWIALRYRSRRAMAVLAVGCLVYFGFIRQGCICPVGAVQHVALALFDPGFALPLTVALLFALPLAFALLFGRVFCASVCPLGVIQSVVLVRPVKVPDWLARALGVVPFIYLGLAVLYAVTDTGFIICRYDPFVSLFRLSGPTWMLIAAVLLVGVSMFVGRPYCRFQCPYGALLSVLSRWSWKKVTITPDECVVCGLCEDACPYGAIIPAAPQGVEEE